MVVKINMKMKHIGFIVYDVTKTAKKLEYIFGTGSWSEIIAEPPRLHDVTVHGKKVSHSFKYALGDIGDMVVELLQPLKGESVYVEYLRDKGEGFHHISMSVSNEEELKEVLKKLKSRGAEVIQTGKFGTGVGYYYVDLKQVGLILELSCKK